MLYAHSIYYCRFPLFSITCHFESLDSVHGLFCGIRKKLTKRNKLITDYVFLLFTAFVVVVHFDLHLLMLFTLVIIEKMKVSKANYLQSSINFARVALALLAQNVDLYTFRHIHNNDKF